MKTLIIAATLLTLIIPAHAEVRDTIPGWVLRLDAKQYAAREAREAAKGVWFLIFDTWFCDVHDCGEGKPAAEDFVDSDFATKQQCLAASRQPMRLAPVYKFAEDTSTPIGRIVPRCVGSRLL